MVLILFYIQIKMKQNKVLIVILLLLLSFLASGACAQQKAIKILAIGNSFSQDAVEQYLYELANAEGIPVIIGNMYIAGCSLERHVKNARSNDSAYAYRKISLDGKKIEKKKMALGTVLADEEWDYVSLQQASPFSGMYETYETSLPELVEYVKVRLPKKTELMLHQTWAYAANATNTGFKNYGRDQLTMYHSIVKAVDKASKLTKIKMIIPTGTAIQNARTSFVGDHMNRDGYHLDLKIGRYTAACTWFEKIFERNVVGNPYYPEGMNYDQREVAQKAAHGAVLHPDRITELTELKEPAAKVNYDESKVPAYTLPDVLTLNNGQKVVTIKEWVKKRRPELIHLFETQMYGKAPAHPKDLHFRVLTEDKNALNGLATRREVAVYLTKDEKHYMTVLIYLPNQRQGAVPMFFGINFKGNHAIHPDEGITLPSEEKLLTYGRKYMFPRGNAASRWPVEMLMKHGYGLATFYRGDIDPDFDDAFRNGAHPLFYKKGQKRPADDEWGTLAAWAWGMSCVMDYFETDKDIDAKRVAIFGHSRLGKTTLWAGAIDPRFALVISNDSGCGGAALSRRKVGETVRAVNRQFTHWFCWNFWQYNDKEENLPVDQHELIALIAPRPVYIASAEEDCWADPRGEFLSGLYASPVYELFGLPGLPVKEMPAVNEPVLSGTIGYHIRSGQHDINLYDWTQYVQFADKHLKKDN